MSQLITKGYKVTDSQMRCRSFQFEIGKDFKETGKLQICNNGFHFCQKLSHCFNYYNFNKSNRVFEIEAYGDIITYKDKSCTLHIKLIKELTWQEVLFLANDGADNMGHSNTGDSNTGNRNTGDKNTGDRNTGYSNTGNSNTGNSNTGNNNTGNNNTGGDRNTGSSNTGNSNTGDKNTGDRNTGYSNTGNRNTGAFCTGDAPFPMFNKNCDWTEKDFLNSKAYELMRYNVDTKIWVPEYKMTDAEKSANKGWEFAGGFVRDIPYKEAFTKAWHNFDAKSREAFTSLPNFDPTIFEFITGVKVN